MGESPVRGQLNNENELFPVSVGAREFVLARQVWPSRPALLRSFSTLRLNLVLTHGIPTAFRDGVHVYRQPPSRESKNLSGHAIVY